MVFVCLFVYLTNKKILKSALSLWLGGRAFAKVCEGLWLRFSALESEMNKAD